MMVEDKDNEITLEIPSTSTNFVKSVGTLISNHTNVLSSRSKIKRGQENIDRDICEKKLENSSADDSSKRLKPERSDFSETIIETKGTYHKTSKFYKPKGKVKKRNYRKKRSTIDDAGTANEEDDEEEKENNDEHVDTNDSTNYGTRQDVNSYPVEDSDGSNSGDPYESREQRNLQWSDACFGEYSSDNSMTSEEEVYAKDITALCMGKNKPKSKWRIVPEIINREMGTNNFLPQRFYRSLHVVEHLGLMHKLNEHNGCVNAISFNQTGNLLASGSDDLSVVIWDWAIGKKCQSYYSGHRSNLYHVKWLPLNEEYLVVTCAQDGQVRLMDLRHKGVSRKIAKHYGPTRKLAVHPETPQVVISVGEDSKVLSIDIREDKPNEILTVKHNYREVALYSIHLNPLNSKEFCVGGCGMQAVRIYDLRNVSTPLHTFCPLYFDTDNSIHITSAVYNYNGTEVLASYSNEDIYLFDAHNPQSRDFVHVYRGRRNVATVKCVNFFGPNSEYVMSGSDCGNIFIWDKNTEAIVQFMPGDEKRVVNCLEAHPHFPVLASCGFDNDVKIWGPSCERPTTMHNLESCIKANLRNRQTLQMIQRDMLENEIFWIPT